MFNQDQRREMEFKKQYFKQMPLVIWNAFLFMIILYSCTSKHTSSEKPEDHLSFKLQVIDTAGPHNPWAKILADINGDGNADVVIGGQKGPLVGYLYPTWEKISIIDGGYDTVDGEAGDIDGDGDNDIIMGGLFWYENPGGDQLANVNLWDTHQIADHPTHDIEIGDIDKDGKLDVITRNQSEFNAKAGNKIYVWLQREGSWETQVIDCPHGEGIDVSDLDGDQDLDIVIGGKWFENEYPIWTEYNYAEWYPNAAVKVADFNNDGRNDIVLTPSELAGGVFKISWYEQPVNHSENWVEHLVQDSTETVVHAVEAADFNNDGWVDIVSAEMHQGRDPDEVSIFVNHNAGEVWTKMVVSEKGSHLVQVADIDLDGDMDVMGANWSGPHQPIEIWLNRVDEK